MVSEVDAGYLEVWMLFERCLNSEGSHLSMTKDDYVLPLKANKSPTPTQRVRVSFSFRQRLSWLET